MHYGTTTSTVLSLNYRFIHAEQEKSACPATDELSAWVNKKHGEFASGKAAAEFVEKEAEETKQCKFLFFYH